MKMIRLHCGTFTRPEIVIVSCLSEFDYMGIHFYVHYQVNKSCGKYVLTKIINVSEAIAGLGVPLLHDVKPTKSIKQAIQNAKDAMDWAKEKGRIPTTKQSEEALERLLKNKIKITIIPR